LFGSDFLLFDENDLDLTRITSDPETTISQFDSENFDFDLCPTSNFLNPENYLSASPSPTNTLSDVEPASFSDSPTLTSSCSQPSPSLSPTFNQTLPEPISPFSQSSVSSISQPLTAPTPAYDSAANIIPPARQFSPPPQPSMSSCKRKASGVLARPKELVDTDILSEDDDSKKKQKRNTAAARRYRDNKARKMQELKEELADERQMKEYWKCEAEKQMTEADKWRTMVMVMMQKY